MNTMEGQEPTPPAISEGHRILCAFFQKERGSVLTNLRVLLRKARLATGATFPEMVDELLQDVADRALRCADVFDPARVPMPWILSIAANLIRQRRVEFVKQRRRTGLLAESGTRGDALDPGAFFESLVAEGDDPEEALASKQQLDSYLIHLSESDRRTVELAILHEMDGRALAEALHTKPGTARVSLHRAIERLRLAVRSGRRMKP